MPAIAPRLAFDLQNTNECFVFAQVQSLIYEGLVYYKDGKVEPALAESWEVSGTSIAFKLRR
jgi:ABC-type transport system substrate-binding protein